MPARLIQFLFTLCFAAVFTSSCVRADETIRIMAANTTSGNGQNYDLGEGNRIFQGLDPDIALVQEMNYLDNTQANFRAWVDANFGTSFSYFREAGNGIPNGIVSRYPILESGEWDDNTLTDRDFVWAKIDIPGDKDLWAISVHLKASSGDSSQRNNQASKLISYINNAQIPAADYLVIGGDFNTYSRTEACIRTLSPIFVTGSPWPVDQSGDGDTNSARDNPYDWVIPDAELNARKTTLVIGANSFPNGLVFDSRDYSPLSAVSPIQQRDSGASGMQHMAVMRAFLIPTNAAPLIVNAANSSSTETVADPDVYEIVRGKSVGVSVLATDDAGEGALKYTWSKTAGPVNPVTFSVNGTNAAKNCSASFQAIGNYTLTATALDAQGLSATSSVRIRVVQTAGSLTLDPPSATLVVNATQAFAATLRDQFNQTMSGSFTWSAGGGGTIDAAGVFTAATAGGPYVITASSGAFSDTSSVTINPASASISLTNLNQTYDGMPKPVTVSTTPAGLRFLVSYAGSPTAPIAAGRYAITATITDPNYQGEGTATLVIAPDQWALWKNTYFTAPEQAAGMALDLEDADSDGLSNLAEYALGTHPRQFTAALPGVLDSIGFSITFTRPEGLPGILYFAEVTENLANWKPIPLEILNYGPIETLRARDPFGPDPALPRFLRLRFERDRP